MSRKQVLTQVKQFKCYDVNFIHSQNITVLKRHDHAPLLFAGSSCCTFSLSSLQPLFLRTCKCVIQDMLYIKVYIYIYIFFF